MLRVVRLLSRSVFTLSLLALLFAHQADAQSVLTGEWKASVKSEREGPDHIHLSFERRTERGHRNQMGQTYAYAELSGLSRAQAESGGPVRFSLVREAGTIECEGSFENGRGAGSFRFTPNQAFVAAMKARGFDFEKAESSRHGSRDTEDRLFAAATLNITTALADDLLSADFGPLGIDDLFKAAIFKVDSKFMREMKASGFPNLGMEELVKARIFKVDAEFVREVVGLGFEREPFESLVKMRIFKVTPEFIAAARGEGLQNLTIEDLVKMKIFNIDADFIRRARAEGVPLEVEQLVQRRIGVGRRQ